MSNNEKVYIHYGSSTFYKFPPVKNELYFDKPIGGLWASPIDTQYGWKYWCKVNHFRKKV